MCTFTQVICDTGKGDKMSRPGIVHSLICSKSSLIKDRLIRIVFNLVGIIHLDTMHF